MLTSTQTYRPRIIYIYIYIYGRIKKPPSFEKCNCSDKSWTNHSLVKKINVTQTSGRRQFIKNKAFGGLRGCPTSTAVTLQWHCTFGRKKNIMNAEQKQSQKCCATAMTLHVWQWHMKRIEQQQSQNAAPLQWHRIFGRSTSNEQSTRFHFFCGRRGRPPGGVCAAAGRG